MNHREKGKENLLDFFRKSLAQSYLEMGAQGAGSHPC